MSSEPSAIPPASPALNIYDFFLGDRLSEGRGDLRAVVTDGGSYSYHDVDERAGRYAEILAGLGVSPGERVLIALPDGIDFVCALFGTLRIGGVVVMVNPHLPTDQIEYFFGYTQPTVGLVSPDREGAFRAAAEQAGAEAQLVAVGGDDFEAELARCEAPPPTHPTAPNDPAMFLFSGGTTGQPKAVVQTHKSFENTTRLYGLGTLGISETDITLSVPKLYFGYATGTNLFFPFAAGATVALFPDRCTAAELFRRIRQWQPTVLVNVPTMVNNLLNAPDSETEELRCLRLATSAGEALPTELHRRWNERWGVPLLDGLGTAEMWHIFISNQPDDVKPGTLGRVVDGFEVLACDASGSPVPTGEVGIMRVRGDSLALGYWREEEKTANAFQGEWFVSGDMISFDQDGYVTYGGRADDMLKVSGKWLSPKELENCLLSHPAVREVAVVGVPTEEGLVKPSAFLIPDEGVHPSDELAHELQEWAKSRLEPYKYPRSVHFLDDLPRTHLGKVDRGALSRSQ